MSKTELIISDDTSILQVKLSEELKNDLLELKNDLYFENLDGLMSEIERVVAESLNHFIDEEYEEYNRNLDYDYYRKRKMGEV